MRVRRLLADARSRVSVDSDSFPLTEISDFGLIVLAVSATVFVALLGMRLADRALAPVRGRDPRRRGRRLHGVRLAAGRRVDRAGGAAHGRRARDHPLRRRASHRAGTVPTLRRPDRRHRGHRDVRDRRARRRGRALRARPRLDPRRAHRRGHRPDRPCRHVLGLRLARDPRPRRDDPRRRGGCERPGRHRADDRDDRARDA